MSNNGYIHPIRKQICFDIPACNDIAVSLQYHVTINNNHVHPFYLRDKRVINREVYLDAKPRGVPTLHLNPTTNTSNSTKTNLLSNLLPF